MRIGKAIIDFVVDFKDRILRIFSHIGPKGGEIEENIQTRELPKARVEDDLISKEVLKSDD